MVEQIALPDREFWIMLVGLIALSFAVGWVAAARRKIGTAARDRLAADNVWLTSALSDSEQRCTRQAALIIDMESEMALLRVTRPPAPLPPRRSDGATRARPETETSRRPMPLPPPARSA